MRNFFLSVSFIVFVKVRIFPLNMHDIITYVAWWWEKYLSKRSLLKNTCSWRETHCIMNTEQISKNIFTYVFLFLCFPFFCLVRHPCSWCRRSWYMFYYYAILHLLENKYIILNQFYYLRFFSGSTLLLLTNFHLRNSLFKEKTISAQIHIQTFLLN